MSLVDLADRLLMDHKQATVSAGPDGLEERTADLDQHFDDSFERIFVDEQNADEAVDESLLNMAAERLNMAESL